MNDGAQVSWQSVSHAAIYFGRSKRTIQHWCENGTLIFANIPVFQDQKRRHWICIRATDPLQPTT